MHPPEPVPPSDAQRLAARTRPDARAAMHQQWRDLLFLHWEVPPASLSPLLPPGVHLDLFDGRAWLGIVPFFMRGVRPRGLPAVPGLSHFLELNVRTYVHDRNGLPGVWFFSLDASNALACAFARARFHLPYFHAAMHASHGASLDYHCLRKGHPDPARYRYRAHGPSHLAEPASLEFFLIERYDLYAHHPDRGLFRGRVHHAPYQIQDVVVDAWSSAPLTWNGMPAPDRPPDHQCYAAAARVEVFKLHPLPPLPAGAATQRS